MRNTLEDHSSQPDTRYWPLPRASTDTTPSSLVASQSAQERHPLHEQTNQHALQARNKKRSKNISNGMLGFLKLKEPSTSAWEDYVRQQKKAAAEKHGRSTAVGIPGASTQKLPDHVPKVNSKWDGLPPKVKKSRSSTELNVSRPRLLSASSTTRQSDSHNWCYVPLPTRHPKSPVQRHDTITSRWPIATLRPKHTPAEPTSTSSKCSTSTAKGLPLLGSAPNETTTEPRSSPYHSGNAPQTVSLLYGP